MGTATSHIAASATSCVAATAEDFRRCPDHFTMERNFTLTGASCSPLQRKMPQRGLLLHATWSLFRMRAASAADALRRLGFALSSVALAWMSWTQASDRAAVGNEAPWRASLSRK